MSKPTPIIKPEHRHFEALEKCIAFCADRYDLHSLPLSDMREIPDLLRTIPGLLARVAELEAEVKEAGRAWENQHATINSRNIEIERLHAQIAATQPQAPATTAGAIARVIRDVCELEPGEMLEESLVIDSPETLRIILERHIGSPLSPATPDSFELAPLTYTNQPDNIGAMKLGRACDAASEKHFGDWIDRGLELLMHLHAEGFGVVPVPIERAALLKERGR